MTAETPLPSALSAEDSEHLHALLDDCSPFDVNGVLGLLHAVAIAPSIVSPSAWLPALLPRGFSNRSPDDIQQDLALLFRLQSDVMNAVSQDLVSLPGPDELPECEAFAAGFTAGAELDPTWIGNAQYWSITCFIAYLGGRLDLLPPRAVKEIEKDLSPDPKRVVARDLPGLILAANDVFKEVRRRALSPIAQQDSLRSNRPGRNDPCPCGSGKKYKRCCSDSASGTEAREPDPASRS